MGSSKSASQLMEIAGSSGQLANAKKKAKAKKVQQDSDTAAVAPSFMFGLCCFAFHQPRNKFGV